MIKRFENTLKNKNVRLCTILALVGTIIVSLVLAGNMAGAAPPINTSVAPIDVNVVNTPNVNVVNTPNVNVSNTPNVNVSNTPNVNVSNTPTVNIGSGQCPPIGITNTTTPCTINPVFVKNIDNRVNSPIQASIGLEFTDNQGLSSDQDKTSIIYNVPGPNRLVITDISADAQLPQGEKIKIILQTQTGAASPIVSYFIIPNLVGTFPRTPLSSFYNDVLDAFQQTNVYAGPGTSVVVQATRNSSAGPGVVTVSISGYLVNIT